ncbi:nicotinamide N-methyltransferase [Ramaria rubella]|nr:nicotinamide N-methyltransferase [Ramaria rubella]
MVFENDGEDIGLEGLFPRPPSPPPPEPTYAWHTRPLHEHRHQPNSEKLSIRLVGSHPLWGHYLWNAARCFASYLDTNADELCLDKKVLELGAGGGLPGLVAALNGAKRVILTDYPDEDLLHNLRINVNDNIPITIRDSVHVQGHIWGRSVNELLSVNGSPQEKFDLILMSDLIFNHSQHDALLQTTESSLAEIDTSDPSPPSKTPCVLVFFTHHRPHLAERDLLFFVKAKDRGWICEKIVTSQFPPMFPDDSGDERIRSTVHGWRLTRST